MHKQSLKTKQAHHRSMPCGLFVLFAGLLVLVFLPAHVSATPLEQLKEHQTSLRCEEMKVALLLRAIGRQAEVNIFVSDDIKDTITLDMEGLSLYEAFKIITDAKQLSYIEKDNIILVEKLSTAEGGLKNFRTEKLCTEYGNAGTYVDQLKPLLSANGKLTVSHRGDCLIVQDLPAQIRRVALILSEMDQPIPQVYIESKIVSVSNEAKKRLGINWDYNNTSTKNPLTGVANLTVTSPSTAVAIGFIRDNLDLGIDLQALQEENMLKILSSPRILVLDGKEAEIKSGKEVPYQTVTGTGTGATSSTSFREANLSLKVSPKIMKDNYITLNVSVTNDSVDQNSSAGGQPLINKQEIRTNLFLENNVTVVIGGILLETIDNQSNRVPILSHIPLLGWLFKNSEKSKERSELLVFITPTIVTVGSTIGKNIPGGPIHLNPGTEKKNRPEKDATEE
jgi:type IV pilus assembly protein PilQ